MRPRLPNLLIIGAMKSGTSSLHEYLNLHPDIFMSEPKEIHYYADANYKNWSIDKYKSFFLTDKKIVGTSPQSYSKCHNKYYQNIPERIFKDSPDIQLIYIVRDPIERYRSHILESYHCDSQEDIKYSIESDNYIKTSMYGMQLKAYLKYFNPKQIYILSLEELKKDSLGEMNKIFDFLGVKNLSENNLFEFKVNLADEKLIPRIIKDSILYRLGAKLNLPFTNRLAKIVAKQFFRYQTKKRKLSDEEVQDLKSILREDIEMFKKLSGKSFSYWNI